MRVLVALTWLCGCADESSTPGDTEGDDSTDTTGSSSSSTAAEGSSSAEASATDTDATSDTGTETGDPQPPIDWEPCPLYTGGAGSDAECVTFEVPLDWSRPDGEQIDLFLKRVGGGDGNVQLYMLFGGPGGSSVGYEDDAEELIGQMPGLEVYLIDHRGTGRSSSLGDLQQAQQQWGEGLNQFTTSNAARDLGWMIERAREDGKSVHVYGASYGSYWTHRYLQLFPDQADGATLLGIAAPGFSFNYWERDFNQAGVDMLALCDDDPVCAAKFGPNAVDHAFQVLVDVSGGHCANSGLTIPMLRSYFASRVAWHWEDRALVPAILYRLERCSAADVAALQNAAPQIANPFEFSTEPPAWSVTLGNHVRLSELTDTPVPSDSELQMYSNASIFTFGSLSGMAAAHQAWPRYTPDELDGEYASTSIPMLMLHGEFDPNAPLDQALPMETQFNGPNQHFFLMPNGLHSWPSPYPGGESCMRQLFLDFLDDPTADPDDCSGDVYEMDFDQNQLAPGFFGTADLWEN